MYWYDKLILNGRISQSGFYVGFLVLMFTSCIDPEEAAEFETDLISVSHLLDSVFQHELDSVQTITKTVLLSDQKSETQQLEDYNVLNDLEIMKKYDIATPRWADFVETSQRDSAGMTLIHYTIQNKRAPVRTMSFIKNGDRVEHLKIYSRKKSVVSQQNLWVEWTPKSGYTLTNESKLIFRKPSKFTMKVIY